MTVVAVTRIHRALRQREDTMKRAYITSLIAGISLLCSAPLFAAETGGVAKQVTIGITYQNLSNEFIAKLQQGVEVGG